MTTDAVPGLTALSPTLAGLPLMKTRALTPIATTVTTLPLAVALMVTLTGGLVNVAVGMGVGFAVGVGVGLAEGEGEGVAFSFTVIWACTVLDCE